MWILTPEGMYSIVQPRESDPIFQANGRPGDLAIRSRAEQDLTNLRENWLPELGDTVSFPNRDYPFRAYAGREDVARAFSRIFLTMDWTNFKDEVKARQGPQRAAIYGRVWGTLLSIEYPDSPARDGQGRFLFDDPAEYEPFDATDIADVYPELFADGDLGAEPTPVKTEPRWVQTPAPKEVAPKNRGRFQSALAAVAAGWWEARTEYRWRREG